MNELTRIISDKRRLMMFLLVPVLTVVLFFVQKTDGDVRSGWPIMLQEAYEYRNGADTEERLAHIQNYHAYLKQVGEQAEKMASSRVLGSNPNSFNYRNIQKTARDFEKLGNVEVVFGADRAVDEWLKYKIADVLYILVLIGIVYSFFDEKRKDLIGLVRSMPGGRGKLTIERIGVLLVASVLYTILLFVPVLLIGFGLYGGLGELNRPIQSLISFKTCTMRVSVREWILLCLCVRVACGFAVSLIVWFVLGFLYQIQLSYVILLLLFGTEYLAYSLIMPQMVLSFLKYLNLFSLVFPVEALQRYVNMNLFGFPVGTRAALLGLLGMIVVVLVPGIIFFQSKRYPIGGREILGKVIRVWNRVEDVWVSKFSIWGFESYKQWILGSVILFLAAGLWIGKDLRYIGYFEERISYSYNEYIREIEGPISEETLTYLDDAEGHLKKSVYNSSMYWEGFLMTKDQVERSLTNAEGKPYEAWIFNAVTFNSLIGPKTESLHQVSALFAMLLMILCSAPLFSLESQIGTQELLKTTVRGREKGLGGVFAAKQFVLFGEVLLIWAIVFLRAELGAAKQFGTHMLMMPIQNLESLQDFPIGMSVKGYLICLGTMRLVSLWVLAEMTAFIGSCSNSWEKTALVSGACFLLTALLYYFGQEWAGYMTLLPFVSGIRVMIAVSQREILPLVWLGWAAAGVLAVFMTKKRWINGA